MCIWSIPHDFSRNRPGRLYFSSLFSFFKNKIKTPRWRTSFVAAANFSKCAPLPDASNCRVGPKLGFRPEKEEGKQLIERCNHFIRSPIMRCFRNGERRPIDDISNGIETGAYCSRATGAQAVRNRSVQYEPFFTGLSQCVGARRLCLMHSTAPTTTNGQQSAPVPLI